MEPNPFELTAASFEQRLHINDGYITFTGDYNTLIKIWVDMDTSGIHTEITSDNDLSLTASFENWRLTERPMSEGEEGS